MSLHQIIYTSCMRGINGVNDGQQVFSYDAGFSDSGNDSVKSLFSYQTPALEDGESMTEEKVCLMPQAFMYRRLEDDKCAVALNTYLGRDYMGSAGRFGNHLSHAVIFDDVNEVSAYPCEFYGSSMLRSSMGFEEVNNPEPPAHLPVPMAEKGYVIDVDTVSEFLSEGDRPEIFKKMLRAMLAFGRERKRVVICDEKENVVKWIAALQYALPLKNALNVNFTTYEFDPSLSMSQICGVVSRGTRYTPDTVDLNFTFDFFRSEFPDIGADDDFFDFIDAGFSFSYESIREFHNFLNTGYKYDKADENIYAAYALYEFLSDGAGTLSGEKLGAALGFAAEYAKENEISRIIERLSASGDGLVMADNPSFTRISDFILEHFDVLKEETRSRFRDVVVERAMKNFLDNGTDDKKWHSVSAQLGKIASRIGCDLTEELLSAENRKVIYDAIRSGCPQWKIVWVIRRVCGTPSGARHAADELSPDGKVGKTFGEVLGAAYGAGRNQGIAAVKCILDGYASDVRYLVNTALSLEGILLDLPGGETEAREMWKYFSDVMLREQPEGFDTAEAVFAEYDRQDLIRMGYATELQKAVSPREAGDVFNRHYKKFVCRNPKYCERYRDEIINVYYTVLKKFGAENVRAEKTDLFALLAENGLEMPFSEELVRDLLRFIPVGELSRGDTAFVRDVFRYTVGTRNVAVGGKLRVLLVGCAFEDIRKKRGVFSEEELSSILNSDVRADLTRLTGSGTDKYFDWIVPVISTIYRRKYEIAFACDRFEMTRETRLDFMDRLCEAYLKQAKTDKNYFAICEFLGVIFDDPDEEICDGIGKLLRKSGKQKVAEIGRSVSDIYGDNDAAMDCWEKIREAAEEPNPIIKAISRLFGKK